MTDREWRLSLKAGDIVAVGTGYVYADIELKTVDRTTATQIIVGGLKFRRETGYRIGGNSWDTVLLLMPTDEIRESVRRQKACGELKRVAEKLDTRVPADRIEAALAILTGRA